jgi:hypothetical protein
MLGRMVVAHYGRRTRPSRTVTGHVSRVEASINFVCQRSRPSACNGRFPANKFTAVLAHAGHEQTFEGGTAETFKWLMLCK